VSDLKEFLDKKLFEINEETSIKVIDINDLGLFFWNRGGKQFVKLSINIKASIKIKDLIESAIACKKYYSLLPAKDFLDCLACLGEDKLKELIKEGCLRNE
jgi:hypothetical protein